MPKIVSEEMQKLREAQLAAEKAKNEAMQKLNAAKKNVTKLADKERTDRLCVRGGYLERYLKDPEMFTDEEVMKLIDFLFSDKFIVALIDRMLDASNGVIPDSVMSVIEDASRRNHKKEDAPPVVPNG